jgi:hypothetical protein
VANNINNNLNNRNNNNNDNSNNQARVYHRQGGQKMSLSRNRPKNVAQPICVKINTYVIYAYGKSRTKMLVATSLISQKLLIVNNRSLGKKSAKSVRTEFTDSWY